jgi:polyhydroxyalkanoate synthesis regulator phasin
LKKRGLMNKKLVAAIAATAIALNVSATAVASADNGKGRAGISSLLSGLVSNGTITQSQADAITKAAQDARAAAKGVMDKNREAINSVITSTLGISLDSLKSRLKAGESLATIAGDKKAALITAISAEINKQIDAAVTAGKLTAAQATAQKVKTTERVTNMVERIKSKGEKSKPGA